MTTTSFSYRAHRPTVVARLQERLAQMKVEVLAPEVRSRLGVHRRRVARTAAGAVGVCGGTAMLATALLSHIGAGRELLPVQVLVATLVAVVASYVVAAVVAPVAERRRMTRLLVRSDDPERDLAIIEGASAGSVVSEWAARWEHASLTVPLVAIALLGPLTLHALVFLAVGDISELGVWFTLSALIVGHAHLVFAGLAYRYARQLIEGTLRPKPALRIWGWVTLTAAIPGIALFALPPILVGITGMFLIYPMCKWAEVALRRERQVVDALV